MPISHEMREFANAMHRGDTAYAMEFLDKHPGFAKKVERDAGVNYLESPLGYAVIAGNVEVADKLLSLGAKMNIPLNISSVGRNTPMAQVMLPSYQDTHPNHKAMQNVFVSHYAARNMAKAKPAAMSSLVSMAASATGMFKRFGSALGELVKSDVVGKGVALSVPSAFVGAGLGLQAAGAVVMSAPAVAGAIAAGLGINILHNMKNNYDYHKQKNAFHTLNPAIRVIYEDRARELAMKSARPMPAIQAPDLQKVAAFKEKLDKSSVRPKPY